MSRSPIRRRIWRDNRTSQGQPEPSAEAEVRRLASEMDGVREQSKGADANWKDAVNRAEAVEGRKRER